MLAGAIILLPSCRRLSYDDEYPASFKGLVDAEEFKIINLSYPEDLINMNINFVSSGIFTFQPSMEVPISN
jgi:hypothetical protein